jgi:alcohol dehydrogenase class IV
MRNIILRQPSCINFGPGCIKKLQEDNVIISSKNILFLVALPLVDLIEKTISEISNDGRKAGMIVYNHPGEPTYKYLESLLSESEDFKPDCIVGVGGGSVLDCAKLLAALTGNDQNTEDVSGINLLNERVLPLICIPTTSGTGSEVSPNAILLNEVTLVKTGIISPWLVPDICYIDPELTISLPAGLTAETGMDALCHCIEAYMNINAHPAVDLYALKGIQLICSNLEEAFINGHNIEARSALSLGSLYGGLCLGPVNTTAVHALSYGLGGRYHISHGLANAILLPEVMRFNFPAIVSRMSDIALAAGVKDCGNAETNAINGINRIQQLSQKVGIPQKLSEIGIDENSLEDLASIAMKVTRLLINNPREVTFEDAINIYKKLL